MWFIQSHGGVIILESRCFIYPVFSQLYYSVSLSISHTRTHTHTHTLSPYTTCLKHIQTHRCTRACLSPVLLHTLYYSDSDTPLCGIHIYIHTYITLLWHTFLCIHTYIHMCINHTTVQFLQLTHMYHTTLCHKHTHIPLILLLLCMWFIVTHFILA